MDWISVTVELPKEETPVLVLLNGKPRVGERRWEMPSYEDTFKAYWYWDDPEDDGQCWEVPDITHWMPIPPAPVEPV